MITRTSRLALGLLAAALGISAAEPTPTPFNSPTTSLTLPSGKTLQVEVLTTEAERARGVMYRQSLPQDRGLLFVFEEPSFYSFWMKNCRFPIDMVWLDDQQRVVHLAERVPPCKRDPCPSYQPLRRALYVLEINAGQARREKALIGARLEFKLAH